MFTMALVLSLSLAADLASQSVPDPCPASSSAWIELSSVPDSLLVPPEFFFAQPTVPIETLIVCAHGVFFNFHAMQSGTSTEYYISFPLPTHEEFAHSVPQDTALSVQAATDPHYIDRYVDRQVVAYTERYEKLKTHLRELLGDRYVEGERLDLTGNPARLKLTFPLVLVWGESSFPFYTYPGIYWRR